MRKKIKIPPPPVRDVDLSALERRGEDGECKMYIYERDGVPVAYRYGPEWVAQMLLMEGGYPTPEEAKEAWLREVSK